jgi:type II secretory pathway component PulJ
MKSGFTLIELILAIFFSGIIMTILFSSFTQINKTGLLAEDLIDMDTRQQIVANQFQKDISGAFVPLQGIVIEEKIEEKKEAKDSVAEKKEKAMTVQQTKKKQEEKPQKILQYIFLSTNKGDQLDRLTFITNNPMRVYPYAQNTEVKPNIVRVVYRLQADKEKKGRYSLMRQEGTVLDFGAYKKDSNKPIKAYELIGDIKNLSIDFLAPQALKEESKKKDEKQSDKKETEIPIIFDTKKEWHSNDLQKDKKQSQLPQFVIVRLTLWDNQQEYDRIITLHFEIPAFGQDLVAIKTQEQKKVEAKKDNQNEKDAKAQVGKGPQTTQKVAAQRHRVLPEINELKASIQDYMNSIRGKTS